MKPFTLPLVAAGLLCAVIAGCNDDDDNGGPGVTPTATTGATSSATASATARATASATPRPTANATLFIQQERLARPLTNEVLATISNNRHKTNNRIPPVQDRTQIAADIRSFFKLTAGRSDAITNVAVAVLVPDVMMVDLSQSGPAAFLGVETGGVTGGKFGGRKMSDDVVDIDLGVIFGRTIPALGLAPDDGVNLTQFTSDNVGFQGNTISVFPYAPPPA